MPLLDQLDDWDRRVFGERRLSQIYRWLPIVVLGVFLVSAAAELVDGLWLSAVVTVLFVVSLSVRLKRRQRMRSRS